MNQTQSQKEKRREQENRTERKHTGTARAAPPDAATAGHISPPDGAPGGRVLGREAPSFHRDSGKIPLFRLQIIRFLTDPGGEYKKSNRITSDCLFILYLLSFLHTFHFIIFAKNKKL